MKPADPTLSGCPTQDCASEEAALDPPPRPLPKLEIKRPPASKPKVELAQAKKSDLPKKVEAAKGKKIELAKVRASVVSAAALGSAPERTRRKRAGKCPVPARNCGSRRAQAGRAVFPRSIRC